MNEQFTKQLVAELIDAQQQALAVLAGAVADTCGAQFAQAFVRRAETAQASARHPTRDTLLATAVQAMKQRLGP